MANKPKKKLAVKSVRPARKPARAKREIPLPVEHRIAVTSVAVSVTYGRDRQEQFELRGTATVNLGAPEALVRTTGFVALVATRAKGVGEITHNPASLSLNLMLTVHVEDADLALLREVFITGTGFDAPDPALVIWARTARPLAIDAVDSQPVIEFGYHLDFDPASLGLR